MLDNDQMQLLSAAIIETVSRSFRGSYSGPTSKLLSLVPNEWDGIYTDRDLDEAIALLVKLNVASRSQFSNTPFIQINHRAAVEMLETGTGMPSHPMRISPLLHEYARFGGDWLTGLWVEKMQNGPTPSSRSGAAFDSEFFDPAIFDTDEPVDSSNWTGLPKQGALSQEASDRLLKALKIADNALEKSNATNEEKSLHYSDPSARRISSTSCRPYLANG